MRCQDREVRMLIDSTVSLQQGMTLTRDSQLSRIIKLLKAWVSSGKKMRRTRRVITLVGLSMQISEIILARSIVTEINTMMAYQGNRISTLTKSTRSTVPESSREGLLCMTKDSQIR